MRTDEAAETVVPTTFIDQAELIWNLEERGLKQFEIAQVMGWSRDTVKNYIALDKIDKEAWRVIGTTFERSGENANDETVPENGTVVPNKGTIFTERLLREILPLESTQQIELVQDYAADKITKGKFIALAKNYKARNHLVAELKKQLFDAEAKVDGEYILFEILVCVCSCYHVKYTFQVQYILWRNIRLIGFISKMGGIGTSQFVKEAPNIQS